MIDIKLLALDLDDSLLNENNQLSARTIRAVKKAVKAGIHVTIATGRMFQSTLPFAQQLELNIPLITYQGALVKTSVTKETFFLKSVPLNLSLEVIKRFRSEGLPMNIYLDDVLYVEEDTKENRDYAAMAKVPMHVVGNLDEYIENKGVAPIKILAIGNEQKLDDLAVTLREQYRDKLYITKSKPYFLEVLNPEANKGNALKAVAEHLKVPAEQVAAVGDSFNDLTMFKYAGLAVVMGNAKDIIKEQADMVIKSNAEDGVAQFIEEYILKESEEFSDDQYKLRQP